MKNVFEKITYISLGVFFLNIFKLIILLIYFIKDENFYNGLYNPEEDIQINNKLFYLQLVPIILYVMVVVFFKLYKKTMGLLELIIIGILTLLINKIFDFRELLFFIPNFRVRLYFALIILFILIVVSLKVFNYYRLKRGNM